VPSDDFLEIDGMFPCGRKIADFEAKEVRFPAGLECDQCVLELTWYTEN